MSALDADESRVFELAELYESRLRSELSNASNLLPGSDRVPDGGDPHALVMLVKGLPGPAEESGAAVLSGPDGEAAARALEALGFGAEYFAVLSRPVRSTDEAAVRTRLHAVVQAVDPESVIALDETAAIDVAAALGMGDPAFGRADRVSGRTVVAVDGLEASLTDPARKKRVWTQFKALVPRAPLW